MRRLFAVLLVLCTLALVGSVGTLAQDATPASTTFTDTMGLPELNVTITDGAFEGLPAETPAGRYVVTIEATAAEGGALGFLQLPDGMTAADFATMLGGPPEGSPEADAGSPVAEGDAGAEEGGEGEDGPPPWFFTTKIAGGAGAGPGQTAQIIVDLTPGEWVAWGDDPEASQPPVSLTVTEGIDPATAAEPAAAVTLRMFEFGFEVEGTLAAGPQTLKVTNAGAQPHFVILLRAPDDITEEQIEQILELDMTGATPAPDSGLPNPDTDFADAAYVGTLSLGASAWVPVDLAAGTYVAICFFPDIATGEPHAFKGMYDLVTVA